jgi:hypothetical protein
MPRSERENDLRKLINANLQKYRGARYFYFRNQHLTKADYYAKELADRTGWWLIVV